MRAKYGMQACPLCQTLTLGVQGSFRNVLFKQIVRERGCTANLW